MFFEPERQGEREREPDPHRSLHACDTLEIRGGIGETGLFSPWQRTGTGLNPGALRGCDTKATPQQQIPPASFIQNENSPFASLQFNV